MRASVPLITGVIPSAIAFGLTARSAGLTAAQTFSLSFFVFAGASQFAAVNMLLASASLFSIVLTTFAINFRHFMLSAALSRKVAPGTPRWLLALISFGITDETFVAAAFKQDTLSVPFTGGLMATFWASWWGTTMIGYAAAQALPPLVQNAMGIALYAILTALVVPSLKGQPRWCLITLLAAALSAVFFFVPSLHALGTGTRVVVSSAVVSALGAAFIVPEEPKKEEAQ